MRNEPTSVISRLSARLARRLYAWAERLQRSSTHTYAPPESGQYTIQTLTSQLPTQGGPPAHWLEHVQPAGPPAHWLEYVSGSGVEQAEATTDDRRQTTERADIAGAEASMPSHPAMVDASTREEIRRPSQQAQIRHGERKPASDRPSVTSARREEKQNEQQAHETRSPRMSVTPISPAITRIAPRTVHQIASTEQAKDHVIEPKHPSPAPIAIPRSESQGITKAPVALNPKASVAPKPLPEARTDQTWHNSAPSIGARTIAPEIPRSYPERQHGDRREVRATDIHKAYVERSDLQIPELPYRFVTLGDDVSQRDMSLQLNRQALIADYWPTLPSEEWEGAQQSVNDAETVKREGERLRRLENEQRGL